MRTMCLHSKGYVLIPIAKHPYANQAGYVPEQRLVMEKAIGKYIDPTFEDVHHIDEDVMNNDPGNLILLTKKEHRRIHAGWKRIDGEWWKTCACCKRFLSVKDNFYPRHIGHNEYVSECTLCIRMKSRAAQQKEKDLKTRVIICPVCGQKKRTPSYAHTVCCSHKCAWVVRKRDK